MASKEEIYAPMTEDLPAPPPEKDDNSSLGLDDPFASFDMGGDDII